MVPEAGLEPAQAAARGILSPLRLPIPPLRQTENILAFLTPIGKYFPPGNRKSRGPAV